MKNLKKFKMIKGLGAPVTEKEPKRDLPTMKKKKFGKALLK